MLTARSLKQTCCSKWIFNQFQYRSIALTNFYRKIQLYLDSELKRTYSNSKRWIKYKIYKVAYHCCPQTGQSVTLVNSTQLVGRIYPSQKSQKLRTHKWKSQSWIWLKRVSKSPDIKFTTWSNTELVNTDDCLLIWSMGPI